MITSIHPSREPRARSLGLREALGLALTLTVTFGAMAGATLAATADGYVLQKGDKLALSVVGATEFTQTLAIDIDGSILVPLTGPVPAVGRTLADVTADVRAAFARTSYTVANSAGDLVTQQILPGAVTLSIAEYRPVYVDGDVQAPGAFAYEPGLTARRAIALAGGYGLARLRGSDPMPQLLALQGDLKRLTDERAAAAARLERVKAQLALDAGEEAKNAGKGPDAAAIAVAGPGGTLAATVTATEQQRLDADRQRAHEVAEHYDAAIEKTKGQIETLEARLKGESEGVAADTEDFQRLVDAQAKGTVSVARLSDGRRTLLLSTTRELETRSALDQAEMSLESLTHDRDRGLIDEHAGHLAEFGEATLALSAIDAALSSTRRQLAYYQGIVADPDSGSDIALVIARPDGSRHTVGAGEDPELAPGDLVSVRLAMPAVTD